MGAGGRVRVQEFEKFTETGPPTQKLGFHEWDETARISS